MFSLLRTKSKSSTTVYNESDQTVLRLPALSTSQLATVASCDDLVFAGRHALLRATTYPGHPNNTSQWRRRQLLPKLLPEMPFNLRSGHREEEEPEWLLQRSISISQEVDRKIVTHLRKKLQRRLDRRLDGIITAEIQKRRAEEDAETAAQEEADKRKDDESLQLTFDTSKLDHMFDVRRHDSEVKPTAEDGAKVEGASVVPAVKEEIEVIVTLAEAPDASGTEASGTEEPRERQDTSTSLGGSRPQSSALSVKDEVIEEVDIDLPEGPDEDFDMAQQDVSPVPTPRLSRPETREDRRLSLEEQVAQITCGDMDIKYTPLAKIIKIFVHAGITDSEEETTALMEQVYPQLKERCHQHGYELLLVDTTWGVRDVISDDHSIVTDVEALIDDCLSINKGINFITLIGQKYGEPMLPTVIPENEFDAIIKAITDEMLQQMAALEARNSVADEAADNVADDVSSVGTDGARGRSREGTRRRRASVMFSRGGGGGGAGGGDGGAKRSIGGFKRAIAKLGKQAVAVKALMADAKAEYPDPKLVRRWYRLDGNTVPAVYRLQKISGQFPDVLRNDASKRSIARYNWMHIARRLQKLLFFYADQVIADRSVVHRYDTSLLERQLCRGLLETADADDRCFWFRRIIEDIEESPVDTRVADYIDLQPSSARIDKAAIKRMKALVDGKLLTTLSEDHVFEYTINWSKKGINPADVRAHHSYIDRMCKDFTRVVGHRIDEAIRTEIARTDQKSALFQEVSQHVTFCDERARSFTGRKDLLQVIKTYIRSSQTRPLVVFGKPGCGRRSVMAKAAKDAHRWVQTGEPATLVRMIGLTVNSTSVRLLLHSLCLQLCHIYGGNPDHLPYDFKGLFNVFVYKLSLANEKRPLLIFLDSLHSLSDEYEAKKLVWLPKELPRHVRLVVSTLTGNVHATYKQLKATLPGDQFVEVGPLLKEDASAMLQHWYDRAGHSVTSEQYESLFACFSQNPCPLYLRTAFSESLRWRSYSTPDETKLGPAVKNIATVIFGRMEKQHGEALTRRCFGYITAAKCGVSGTEVEDLVSIDEFVMDEVTAQLRPPKRRLPTLLWLRLRGDLGEHLTRTADNGCTTLRWSHAEFHVAAVERYLNQRDKAPSYHRVLAEYFSDAWSGRSKPFGADETGVRRHVVPQPLYWLIADPTTSATRRVYNQRRLVELPYNLLNSQQYKQLKADCLCNFDFVLAKITSFSLRAILDDLQMALTVEPSDEELKLLSDMLHLSTDVLLRDPGQLGSQVVGRLHDIITADVPVAPSDPVKYPTMKAFLDRASHPPVPTLLPSVSCLMPPGGILYDFLSGHTQALTAVTATSDGQKAVTTSRDDTMKIWEMRSGRVTKTISGVGRDITHIRLVVSDRLAATSQKTCIRLWNLATGDCVSVFDQYEDPASLTTAGDDKLIVGFFQGSNTMRTWSLLCGGKMSLQREVSIVDPKAVSIHKDESVAVSARSYGQQVLYAFRGTSEARVRNAVSGKLVHSLQCPATGCIMAVATSPEYFVCAAKSQLSRTDEIYTLELFDVKTGKHVRALRGCIGDNVAELWVNQLGSHAIAVCTSPANNSSDIAVWNLETEEHKHMARHAGVSRFGACADLRYCMTSVHGEASLRVWNLSTAVNAYTAPHKQRAGVEEIVLMRDDQRYVVAKSVNNGPLRMFDISGSGECVENGERVTLAEVGDVVLVRNGTVVVLAGKGFSSVSDEDRAVFQSVTMYDLLAHKYTRQLKDCFVVPSPPHEYVLLDDEHLMGVSDNRNHFVIWSLSTGHVASRIKNNFRSMERRRTNAGVRDGVFGSMSLLGVANDVTTGPRQRGTTAKMTPWDRRTETHTARQRRHQNEEALERQRLEELHREKSNGIEQFLISDDASTIVASYYGHHMCVFDVPSQQHVQTLENASSMLLLHVAALSGDGSHLVHANYDDDAKLSYVTVWHSHGGYVKKRLRNERNVCALAMTDEARRVVIAKANNELRVWHPGSGEPPRKIHGYVGFDLKAGVRMHLVKDGALAVIFAGDISVWDLDNECVVSVFTPDVSISCFAVAMAGTRLLFGLYDKPEVITLLLTADGRDLLQPGTDVKVAS